MTKTLCPYCGVGCGLEVSPPAQPGKKTNRDSQGHPIWKAAGDRDHPSSKGMVCVKGATVTESLHKDRLKYPMMRDSLDEPFQQVSWEAAFDRITSRLQDILATQGPDAICMYGSGQLQTEDYYTAQKLMKGCLGTNNFDANSRLCMSSAVAAYTQSFGADGPPCCYDDLEQTDCAFLIGTNTAECHPIVFNRFRKYHKRNRHVKLIVVDPRATKTAEPADLHLAIQPGTDIDLLHGIGHLLLKWGMIDAPFVEDCTQGFPQYAQILRHYPPDVVARRCGIEEEDLQQAARYWAESERVLSMWSMGINQSSEGTAKARSLIDLHLMTGNIGKPGTGPFSLTGQPNAMGGREAGGLAHILPGYRSVKNAQHRAQVEQFWGLPAGRISPYPGRSAWEAIVGLEMGDIGCFWVAATNPAVSMPDIERAQAAMKRSPFTVYQDAYYPTETASYAHVVLPAAQWSEKDGIMTNSERVVTLCPAFRYPPGQAKADWEIFAEVGRRLGFVDEFNFTDAAEVHGEFVQLTRDRPCDMTGISHQKLQEYGPIQWPHTDTSAEPPAYPQRLYTDFLFHTPNRRARFAAAKAQGLAELCDENYPYILTTGRLYGHWHTQTRTGRIEKITKMHPEPFLEIHPRDALKLDIPDKNLVEVRSRRGKARFPAKITKAIAPGTVFVPMHWGFVWGEGYQANAMTHSHADPDSLQPELKACAVQLIPVKPQASAIETPTTATREESLV